MTRAKNFGKPNGHAGSAGHPNGHAPAPPSRETCATHAFQGGAASDDSRAFPSTAAANPAAAGMERDECAEVAPPQAGGRKKLTGNSEGSPVGEQQKAKNQPLDIPPGVQPLAKDGPGFVDAMHAHVDLYLACARLVRSGDEKIAQRMVERLLEMCYGKSPSAANEESPEFVMDIDSAVARRAAQGAKQ